MLNPKETYLFEEARPTLLGLAYRILGSLADAEDAVQDTFIKWQKSDREDIRNERAWLTTVCTRRCLDELRASHRSRVNYVGNRLPEPIHTSTCTDTASDLELASTLTTAFLVVLDRLTPKERAAYLLHEIFGMPYKEISEALGLNDSTCRKLASRAKVHIDNARVRYSTPVDQQDKLLNAFHEAVTNGSVDQLLGLLSDDIQLRADGGGKVAAILEAVQGKGAVAAFIADKLHRYWNGHQWQPLEINGERGFLLRDQGAISATVSFAYDKQGDVSDIFIMRNPDKLNDFEIVSIR